MWDINPFFLLWEQYSLKHSDISHVSFLEKDKASNLVDGWNTLL